MNTLSIRMPSAGLLLSLALLAPGASATPVTILDENFNDVTGMSGATTVRPVSSVLTDTPNPLPGALWSASSGADANTGIRRTDNNINANLTNSFGSFFTPVSGTNNFLVLGDQVGPNTGVANQGVFGFALPFTVPSGATSINVSFDWGFSGDDTSSTAGIEDIFTVGIAGSGFEINSPMSPAYTILSQTSPNTSGVAGFNLTGQVDVAILSGLLPPAAAGDLRYLVFGLSEHTSTATNTAAGIDNIHISAVPIPAALWLFGSALAGIGSVARRRNVVAG